MEGGGQNHTPPRDIWGSATFLLLCPPSGTRCRLSPEVPEIGDFFPGGGQNLSQTRRPSPPPRGGTALPGRTPRAQGAEGDFGVSSGGTPLTPLFLSIFWLSLASLQSVPVVFLGGGSVLSSRSIPERRQGCGQSAAAAAAVGTTGSSISAGGGELYWWSCSFQPGPFPLFPTTTTTPRVLRVKP